jgi:hypothetical protein
MTPSQVRSGARLDYGNGKLAAAAVEAGKIFCDTAGSRNA